MPWAGRLAAILAPCDNVSCNGPVIWDTGATTIKLGAALGLLSCLGLAAASLRSLSPWFLPPLVPTSTVGCPRPRFLPGCHLQDTERCLGMRGRNEGNRLLPGTEPLGGAGAAGTPPSARFTRRRAWTLSCRALGCSCSYPPQVFNHFHAEPCQCCRLSPAPQLPALELFPSRRGEESRQAAGTCRAQLYPEPHADAGQAVGRQGEERPSEQGDAPRSPRLLPVTDETPRQHLGCPRASPRRLQSWEEQGCG